MPVRHGFNSLVCGCLIAVSAASAVETEEKELSLADLMGLQNAIGTLTRMERNKVPVSVTTITEEDIRLTPARNLLDVIEALVPGAMYADHPEQARLGMRGIIVDRNYKFLLLVDGHLMNQKTHSGVVTEIQNWDMSDIKQVEIIRGPGSVTYGPGAVAGVIAIKTKSAEDAQGITVSTAQVVPYSSQGGTIQYGKIGQGWSMYSYLNATWTKGYQDPAAWGEFGDKDFTKYTWGRIGSKNHKDPGRYRPSQSILGDYDRDIPNMPQIRAHVKTELPYGLSGWMRYTQGGTTTGTSFSQIFAPDSQMVDARTFYARQLVGSIKHQFQLAPDYTLSSKLEAGSQDFERYNGGVSDSSSLTSPMNTTHNFAESDFTAQTLLNTTFMEKYQIAIGAEYVYSKVGPGWFDDPRALRVGDGQDMVNGPDSWIVQTNRRAKLHPGMKYDSLAFYLGDDGFSTNTYSLLSEANLAFSDYMTVLLSGRADKNSLSAWMLSPRVALVSAITPRNIVKGIWQRSMRMGNLEQMYMEDLQGIESKPEVLEGYELIYTALPTDNLTVNLSGYRNDVESVGWSTDVGKTVLQGTMIVYGSELDARWKNEKWLIGLSHSLTYLGDWKLAEGQTTSGVSYADLALPVYQTVSVNRRNVVDTLLLSSTGSSINNWSENISKAQIRYKVTPTFSVQGLTRVFWGFQGYQDQLDVLKSIKPMKSNDTVFANYVRPKIDSLVKLVEDEDPYGIQWRFDLSAEWEMSKNVRLTGMVQNMFGIGENRRFDYISGLKGAAPRTDWIEEPRTYYLKLSSTF